MLQVWNYISNMSTFSFPIPKRHFDKKTKKIYSIYIFKVAMFLKTGVDIYIHIYHWWIFLLEQKFVEMVFSIHVCKISLPTDDRLPWMIRFAYHSCNKNKIYKSKCKSGFSWTRWWYLVQFINITIPKVKVKFIQLNYYWLFLNIVFIQLFCENTGKVSSWYV